ncbi:MAG: Methyltransferase [Microgenomates group bacterium GW2011_GWA2_44_7]|nr:MAG: Methyltransferase [Microgenomates group bacterium GW2011_GWA2_44_7]KKT78219.1 MAG: Methyltransferase [Microgenomates group bacterium GW2011_GWB1_44_8]
MSDTKWIDEFFGSGFYADVYQLLPRIKQAEEEVEAVLSLLKPQPHAQILDWCGGWGRHAIPLAKRGFRVTLLDYTPLHVEMAGKLAVAAGVSLELIQADFRYTPPTIQADLALNLFTSGIGFMQPEDDEAALRSLYAALKPGAKILVDTMSVYWIAREYRANSWQELEGERRLLEERHFDYLTGRNYNRMVFLEPGLSERERSFDVKVYTPHELATTVARAGFVNPRVFGDLKGGEFDFESRRLVLVAEKP